MSYQHDRDQFVAAMTREGLPLHVTEALLRAATGFQRRAELACSSEAADRDRVPCPASKNKPGQVGAQCLCNHYNGEGEPHELIPRITLQDWRAEERLRKLLHDHPNRQGGLYRQWELLTAGDPRGYTLRVIPPSYIDRNIGKDQFNRDSIGVPARDSRLRF